MYFLDIIPYSQTFIKFIVLLNTCKVSKTLISRLWNVLGPKDRFLSLLFFFNLKNHISFCLLKENNGAKIRHRKRKIELKKMEC